MSVQQRRYQMFACAVQKNKMTGRGIDRSNKSSAAGDDKGVAFS